MKGQIQQEFKGSTRSLEGYVSRREATLKLLTSYTLVLLPLLILGLAASNISPWATAGIVFSGLVFLQMGRAFRSQVPFIHLTVFTYLFQFVLASLLLYYYPPYRDYNIGHARYSTYLAYVVPACLALYIGMALGGRRFESTRFPTLGVGQKPPTWVQHAKALCILGLLWSLLLPFLPEVENLQFFFKLIGALRWVGLFTLILTGERTWWIYGSMILGAELVVAISQGMFGELLLWGQCAFLIIAFRYKWGAKALFVIAGLIMAALVLQAVKPAYRKATWGYHGASATAEDKFSTLSSLVSSEVSDSSSLSDQKKLSATLVRFNQGWIVNRVMLRVPDVHPYAEGATLMDGLEAALLPRVLLPDKIQAGGRSLFSEFTGMRLLGLTSMTISTMGEMYGNFGPYGGIIGMGVFGLALGLLYRWLSIHASRDPVWWAWGPFIGMWAMKPEEDLSGIENWIVKALVVMGLVVFSSARISRTRSQLTRVRPPAGVTET